MNAQPHTHVPKVRRTYEYSFQESVGRWFVEYGDSRAHLAASWRDPREWGEKRLARKVANATRRAIRKHDRGSVVAGDKAETLKRAQSVAAEQVKTSEWAPR